MLGLAIACTVLTTVTADSPTAIPWDGRVSPSFRKEYEVLVNPDDVAAGTNGAIRRTGSHSWQFLQSHFHSDPVQPRHDLDRVSAVAVGNGRQRRLRVIASTPSSRKSAQRSPIMIEGALVFARGIWGSAEASATRRLSTPRTRNISSRGLSASLPIATLHAGWAVVFAVFLMQLSISPPRPGTSSRSTVDARR
jgi:hypothetical protein